MITVDTDKQSVRGLIEHALSLRHKLLTLISFLDELDGRTLLIYRAYMASSTSEVTVERVLQRVREALIEIEERYRSRGRSVAELGVEELAARMAAVVPLPSPVNDQIGPFYRTEQVARLLGVSRQAVHDRAKRGAILVLRTADDVSVYPTFQFEGRRLVSGLRAVLTELHREDVDRWAVAAWLVSPTAALGGASPLETIRAGGDLGAVRDLARDARRRWTQ